MKRFWTDEERRTSVRSDRFDRASQHPAARFRLRSVPESAQPGGCRLAKQRVFRPNALVTDAGATWDGRDLPPVVSASAQTRISNQDSFSETSLQYAKTCWSKPARTLSPPTTKDTKYTIRGHPVPSSGRWRCPCGCAPL
jgi:hypothetical protein